MLSSDFFEEAAEAPESETQSFKIKKNLEKKILQKNYFFRKNFADKICGFLKSEF